MDPLQLEALHIRRFRNLSALDWEPAAGVNLIVGDNGQGKTNLLEAIHMVLLGRSFRTRREEECLSWDAASAAEDATRIDAALRGKMGGRRLRLALGRGWKRIYRDGQLLERLADLWQGAGAVAFSPDDVDLFRDAPGRRRRFLDLSLCQVSSPYLKSLQRYYKALRQTNALLKQRKRRTRTQAEAFYALLGESGAALMRSRGSYLASLAEASLARFADLGGDGELQLDYEPSLKGEPFNEASDEKALAAAIAERLTQMHDENERFGMLGAGPHRDDFRARLDGHDLGRYGSQGQHRLAALCLKLAVADRLSEGHEESPVLLLDDFGSELDAERRRAVLENVRGRMQVFVTATQIEALGPPAMFDEVRAIRTGAWA